MAPGTPQRGLTERLALWRDVQETLGRGVTRHDWATHVRPDVHGHRDAEYKVGPCRCASCQQFDRTLQQVRRYGIPHRVERVGAWPRLINEYRLV